MIVVSSDWHFHPFKEFSLHPSNLGVNWRVQQCREAVNSVLKAGGVHIIGGDFFESKAVKADVMVDLVKTIDRGPLATGFCIPGNHDGFVWNRPTNLDVLARCCKGIINAQFVNHSIDGYSVTFIPFMPEQDFGQHMSSVDPCDIIVCHQTITGIENDFGLRLHGIDPDVFVGRCKMVLCGHTHKPQVYEHRGVTIVNIGSLMATRFGDCLEHGYWLLWSGFEIEFKPLRTPRFIIANSWHEVNDRDYFRLHTSDIRDARWNVRQIPVPLEETTLDAAMLKVTLPTSDPFIEWVMGAKDLSPNQREALMYYYELAGKGAQE